MDPMLVEYLRRQTGMPLPTPAFEQQPAPPVDVPTAAVAQPVPPQAPAPPLEVQPAVPPPEPPPTDFRALLYRNLGDMTKQLGPDFSPEALRAAQQQDIQGSRLRTLGDSLTRGAALVRNQPVGETAPINQSQEAVQRLMQRRGDVLGTAEAATKLQGMLMQQSLMDPASPMSRAKQDQLLRMDPEFVQRAVGGPVALRQLPGILIDQYMAMRGQLAETRGKETTALKTGAEATEKIELQKPVAPEHLAMLAEQGFKIPPGTTYAQAKDLVEQNAKGQALRIDWAKLALEQKKTGIEGPALKLRQEFQGQQTYKDMQDVAAAYRKLRSASKTEAGDVTLVYALIKMNNPGATVREGNKADVENAGGVPAKILNVYNRLISGEKLPPEVRAQFINEAHSLYAAQKNRYEATANQYRRLAADNNVSPEDVVLDIGLKEKPDKSPEERAAELLGGPK